MSARNGSRRAIQVITGEVEAISPKGIKVRGEWANFSHFDDVPRPPVGSQVRVEVSARGWIKGLEILDGSASREPQEANLGADRQQIILRLACLKAAAEFAGKLAAGQLVRDLQPIKSAEVLVIGELWEEWVSR